MNKTLAMLALSIFLTGSISGCADTSKKAADDKSGKSDSSTAAASDKSDKSDTAASASDKSDKSDTAATNDDKSSSPETKTAAGDSSQSVNLDTMNPGTTICNVNGKSITVGDYKNMYKLQQIQLQTAISGDPASRQKLIEEAHNRGIQLSDAERAKLMAVAKDNQNKSGVDLKTYLKEKNLTEAQFEQQIDDIGLAYKAADAVLQQNLLNDLVNRELLCQEADKSGLSKKAMNRYIEIKHSPTYDTLIKSTGFSTDELKDELIRSDESKLMAEKIQKRTPVSESEIRAFYNKNQKMFHHNERIRLSQILIAAPTVDMQGVQSIKTQAVKQNPKLKGKELDNVVKNFEDRQQQKAGQVLMTAKVGVDFAKLANQYSDDMRVKTGHTGGDMGYQEKKQLIPQFAKIVWPLKAGAVIPQVVRTPLGFQIFKVTAHEGPGVMSLSEVREPIRENLQSLKGQQALADWIKTKRQSTKIVLAPRFDAMLNKSKDDKSKDGKSGTLTGMNNNSVQH